MMEETSSVAGIDRASDLPEASRESLRDLILSLADNKRILGIRYSDWMLGAPSLETGIAASSMAQDEWGHGRLTYALLSEFGDEPKALEHGRESEAYHSMEPLDSKLRSWSEMIAVALILDTALTVQYGALLDSRYTPVHNRVQKLLDEEAFHFQYAAGWVARLTAAEQPRAELLEAAARLLPLALRWLGRPDSPDLARLAEEYLVAADGDGLRDRYLARVAPVLERAGLAAELGLTPRDGGWRYEADVSWSGWDESRRRSGAGGPDADTLARARGDKNRAMLLD